MSGFGVPSPTLELPRVVKAVRTKAPPVPRDVQQRALQTTAKYIQLARSVFGKPFPMPTVAFDLRGKTAGQAFLGRNLVRLNAVLLVENEADFHADTIPHEVAHLVATWVYGHKISAHGPEWQLVMRKLGVTPRRTHSYDVSNSAVGGIHQYACGCGRVRSLGSRKHRKAAKGLLVCMICNTTLRPVGSPAPRPGLPVRPALPARPPVAPTARPVTGAPRTPPPPVRLPGSARPVTVPAPASVRAATPAQLQFALALANKLGIALLPEHVSSFERCSDFISRHKVLMPTKPAATFEPSERQLQYAKDIARRRGLTLSADTMRDGRKLSAWIDQNR